MSATTHKAPTGRKVIVLVNSCEGCLNRSNGLCAGQSQQVGDVPVDSAVCSKCGWDADSTCQIEGCPHAS